MKTFSRLRWIFLCCFGRRHRRMGTGEREAWTIVQKGKAPIPVSRCTRCGLDRKGRMTL